MMMMIKWRQHGWRVNNTADVGDEDKNDDNDGDAMLVAGNEEGKRSAGGLTVDGIHDAGPVTTG
jgi:hypothetical protein